MTRRILLGLWVVAWPLQAAEETRKAEPDYVRFEEDSGGAGRLQTAIGKFTHPSGVTVDLIGAVHLADKAYYDDLNKRFAAYEAVLYELVGGEFSERKNKKLEPESERLKWLGTLQTMMQNALKLAGQLEGINYTAKNLVHADMGTHEFFETQAEQGESFVGLWLKAWQAQMKMAVNGEARQDQPGLAKILEILCRKDSPTELKRLIGREFDQIERLMDGIEADGGTVIIGERNRLALEVLDREIAKGRKNLGVFYGAAHLPDMEQRLLARGFKKTDLDWLTAWDIPPPAPDETAPQKAGDKQKQPADIYVK